MKLAIVLVFSLLLIATATAQSYSSVVETVESAQAKKCALNKFAQGCTWKMGPAFVTQTESPTCYDHKFAGRICPDNAEYAGVYSSRQAKIVAPRGYTSITIGDSGTFITKALDEGDTLRIVQPQYVGDKWRTAGYREPYYYIQHERMTPRGPQVIKGNLGKMPIIKRQGHNTDLDVTVRGRYFN